MREKGLMLFCDFRSEMRVVVLFGRKDFLCDLRVCTFPKLWLVLMMVGSKWALGVRK